MSWTLTGAPGTNELDPNRTRTSWLAPAASLFQWTAAMMDPSGKRHGAVLHGFHRDVVSELRAQLTQPAIEPADENQLPVA